MTAFVAVAEARSFRRAADRLNLRPSTMSHAVKALEERLGIKLLARTTRSVAPTQAGAALLAEIGPALATLDHALELTNIHRIQPRGTVRITVPQSAAVSVLAPRLSVLVQAYPDVTLEVSVNDGFVDIVREGFDAGIRLGESVAAGMTAVPVSAAHSAAVVASPEYWNVHGRPSVPHDLTSHRCINRRYAAGRGVHRWQFAKGEAHLEVACTGPLILDSEWLMRVAALEGAGVALLSEEEVAHDIASGRLERALDDWCPPIFRFFLYHPSHALPSASLRALIDTFRLSDT